MGEKNEQIKKKIIKSIYNNNSLSIGELCIKVDKSLPVISKFLNELIEEGYIAETGFASSSGGRRPVMYSRLQAPIQQALNEHCIPRLSTNTNVEISTLGYQAELIGAAALVMEHYEKKAIEKNSATEY